MPHPNQQIVQIPDAGESVKNSVDTLLDIVTTVCARIQEGAEDSNTHEFDGGVKSSLEVVVMKACTRLEAIIERDANFSAKAKENFLKALTRTQVANQQSMAASTAAAAEVLRPSYQLRPTLVQVPDGFIAYYGNPGSPAESIVGAGPTPDAALRDFDAAFKRPAEEQKKLVTEPTSPTPTETTKTKKRK